MKKLLLIFACIFPLGAHAEFWTGTKLMQLLEEDQRGEASYSVGSASGFIVGVADALEGVVVCIPQGVTVKQIKQVVFNHMKSQPETWNQGAAYVTASALRRSWPCSK